MKIQLLLILALASSSLAAELRLSSDGPLKPPEAAREAARAAVKFVRIVVADGVYPLSGSLLLDGRDSQVTWEAAPGAKPVFHGGRAITCWTRTNDGLWKATLPDKAWHFEQLWIDGRRATRARSPNKGFFHITGRPWWRTITSATVAQGLIR